MQGDQLNENKYKKMKNTRESTKHTCKTINELDGS
jgi:hypothetical protein